ncbi:hypothetical protein LDENG_00081320 [Lucifuga dentata]|nr:hypothetical protein LDENG_00081320 [Lucifuga dentata]
MEDMNKGTDAVGAGFQGSVWIGLRDNVQDDSIKKQIVKIKLKTLDSTINLNDPDVADAILKQIEKGMKDQGITNDFKIKWIKRPDREIFYKEENDKNEDVKEEL